MATSYLPEILIWHDCPQATPSALAVAERMTDAAHARTPGMHDPRVEIGVSNAFQMGDSTGSDDFGYSVAWVDLSDHLDIELWGEGYLPHGIDYWNVGAWVATWQDMSGCRYALAYWNADGSRSLVGYSSHSDMMSAYRALESEFLAWDEAGE